MLFSTCLFVCNARSSLSRCSNSTKIVVRWGFASDPTGGAYSAPPDPLAGFKGPWLLLLRGEEGRDGRGGRGGKGRGGEDTEKLCTPKKFLRIGPDPYI